jgi:hypothetical protein
MADERSRPRYSQASPIPSAYAWPALLAKDGDALFDHYRRTLETLIGGAHQGRIGRGRGSMPHLVGAAGRGRSHRSVADFLLSCNP